MIAEPWDLGIGGYRLGEFPPRWSEWNDRYRNTVRAFWRGDENVMREMAHRITGSDDVFGIRGRPPRSSVNFITAHDGFTLEDLVSYSHKHNEANHENNRDGCGENFSCNFGVEGLTHDKQTNKLRRRQKRNFIATLMLSQGIPMLLGGDEVGRTQNGNNNAYCQDNATSWTDWSSLKDNDFFEFVKKMISIRSNCAVFHRKEYFTGEEIDGGPIKDITWWSENGHEMSHDDWHVPHAKSFGFHIASSSNTCSGERLMVLMNAHHGKIMFRLPPASYGNNWHKIVDTACETDDSCSDTSCAGDIVSVQGFSLVLLSGAPASILKFKSTS